MAFCITRSTWKVSKLFYRICDWVRVNKHDGNVLRNTYIRLVPDSDRPSGGKLVYTSILCWRGRAFRALINKYVEAFVQGEGPGPQQTHAHLHGRGAPGPAGFLGYQQGRAPNAHGNAERGRMCKFPSRRTNDSLAAMLTWRLAPEFDRRIEL